jgi:hypothetical protein
MQGTEVARASTDNIFVVAIEAYKALVFLECANIKRYITLWQPLRNEALIGQDNYPRYPDKVQSAKPTPT